ncbi:MAG: hypothetical protein ACPHL6_10720, partial [Rubripirellula sp.]
FLITDILKQLDQSHDSERKHPLKYTFKKDDSHRREPRVFVSEAMQSQDQNDRQWLLSAVNCIMNETAVAPVNRRPLYSRRFE